MFNISTEANLALPNGLHKPLGSISGRNRIDKVEVSTSYDVDDVMDNAYEWNHQKSLGPVKLEKHLNDAQTFWRQSDSVSFNKVTRAVLPGISKNG